MHNAHQFGHLIGLNPRGYHIGPPCAKAFETVTNMLTIGFSHDLKLAKTLEKGNEEKSIQSSRAVE